MNYYKLEKLATPRPWTIAKELPTSGTAIAVPYGSEAYNPNGHRMMFATSGPNNEAVLQTNLWPEDMALIVHCVTNFSKVLEALKDEHAELIEENDAQHLIGECQTCKLIAELEEVK